MKKKRKQRKITLTVNGNACELEIGDRTEQVRPWDTLAHTLRDTLGLTGTKVSCDHGACGGCTVLLEGKTMLSCMTLTVECDGQEGHDRRGVERSKDREA